jgi:uncharacterized Zn finger protein
MAVKIECAKCGETKRLTGRREGRSVFITCEACGHAWERHPDICPACGKRTISPRRMPLLQKARGTQQSIIGYWIARECRSCGWASAGPEETSAV